MTEYSKRGEALVESVAQEKVYSMERIKAEVNLAQERLDFWTSKLNKAKELGIKE